MASEESIYHLMKCLCSHHFVKNKFQIGLTHLIKKQLLKSYEVLLEHESRPESFTILEKLYSYIERLRSTNNSPTATKLDIALQKLFHLGLDDGLVRNLLQLLLMLANSSKKPAKDATLCHFPILTLNKFETTLDEGFNEDSPTGSLRGEEADDGGGRQEKDEDDDVWEHLHLKNQQIITYSSWDSSRKFMKPSELPYITDLVPSIHPPVTSPLLTSSDLQHPSIHQSIHQSILLKSLCHAACTSSASF
ncbi:hypothetical protein HELRODRAFT_189675, partial [Helobdella robusta]|uniref:Uncharacterized protein n=1 Tax=Helobdella robusta TaxID=6412 RepID=T1FR90_HELRO